MSKALEIAHQAFAELDECAIERAKISRQLTEIFQRENVARAQLATFLAMQEAK